MTTSALLRGDIILTKFPFTDLTGSAVCPALIVSTAHIGQDVILGAISSVVRGTTLAPTDYIIDTFHPEFVKTGLRVTSVFRMHKLVTVEHSIIIRRLGCIGPQLQLEIDKLLRIVLHL